MRDGKIVVFGSYVTDLTGRSKRLPVQGETVKGISFKSGPGGKGSNQAVAAHRAGADVTLITKLGDDTFGKYALDFYEEEKMCTDGILIDKKYETGAALIMVDDSTAQNAILVIIGACDHFTDEDVNKSKYFIDQASILVAQLETNLEATIAVIKYAREKGLTTILNPAPAQPLDESFLKMIDIITPNETEASLLTGVNVDDNKDNIREAASRLLEKGVKKVIITLGKNGVYANDGKEELFLSVKDYGPVVDSTGAGDAFNGGFAARLAEGFSFFEAVKFGSVVGSLSVTRVGTAPVMPMRDEIMQFYEHQ